MNFKLFKIKRTLREKTMKKFFLSQNIDTYLKIVLNYFLFIPNIKISSLKKNLIGKDVNHYCDISINLWSFK